MNIFYCCHILLLCTYGCKAQMFKSTIQPQSLVFRVGDMARGQHFDPIPAIQCESGCELHQVKYVQAIRHHQTSWLFFHKTIHDHVKIVNEKIVCEQFNNKVRDSLITKGSCVYKYAVISKANIPLPMLYFFLISAFLISLFLCIQIKCNIIYVFAIIIGIINGFLMSLTNYFVRTYIFVYS